MSWDHIEIQEFIAVGGSSSVFLGEDKRRKEALVVKLSAVSAAKAGEFEILDLLRRFPHPNVAQQKGTFTDVDECGSFEEYCAGGDLRTLMERLGGPLSEASAKKLFGGTARGLLHLHRLGIVHRDIKLENIVLDQELQPKLSDFNYSFLWEQNKPVQNFCGSLDYVAPETFLRNPLQGPALDVWAMGVLLFAMLYCRFPFEADTPQDLAAKVVHGRLVFPHLRLSEDALSLINWMLQKDHNQRPSIQQVLAHPFLDLSVSTAEDPHSNPPSP